MIADDDAPEAEFRSGMVALVGRPNVGKSTLLNRLVGVKIAAVSDKPQTTRNRIIGVVERPGAQLALIDTPGLHRPLHRMNERMLQASLSALEGVDLVAALTDVTEAFGNGDRYLVRLLSERGVRAVLVLNKIDRLRRREEILPILQRWSQEKIFEEFYPISAATGEGIEAMERGFLRCLPPGPRLFPEGQKSDLDDRFQAAEIVREQVLLRTRAEIPYSTTVIIEDFQLPAAIESGMARIEATILVDRDSQRGIIIGKGGAALKAIGQAARLELEGVLGRKVFLGLVVKARAGWREDDRILDRLGLPRP